jgi:renal tumor antigen
LTDGYYGPEMDLWGAGCVMFEITSLYPLFPGSNEVDQISRIHKVLGTPGPDLMQKFKSKGASHVSFDFAAQKGIGIPQLIPHASADCIDLIVKLLKYVCVYVMIKFVCDRRIVCIIVLMSFCNVFDLGMMLAKE